MARLNGPLTVLHMSGPLCERVFLLKTHRFVLITDPPHAASTKEQS